MKERFYSKKVTITIYYCDFSSLKIMAYNPYVKIFSDKKDCNFIYPFVYLYCVLQSHISIENTPEGQTISCTGMPPLH